MHADENKESSYHISSPFLCSLTHTISCPPPVPLLLSSSFDAFDAFDAGGGAALPGDAGGSATAGRTDVATRWAADGGRDRVARAACERVHGGAHESHGSAGSVQRLRARPRCTPRIATVIVRAQRGRAGGGGEQCRRAFQARDAGRDGREGGPGWAEDMRIYEEVDVMKGGKGGKGEKGGGGERVEGKKDGGGWVDGWVEEI